MEVDSYPLIVTTYFIHYSIYVFFFVQVRVNLTLEAGEDEIVSRYSSYTIKGRDFMTLKNNTWLNDQVLQFDL